MAQLGLHPQEPGWRLAELRHEIATGEPVMTIRAAADRLGISDAVARSLALKLGLRLVGFPAMFPADDFERLRDRSQARAAPRRANRDPVPFDAPIPRLNA